jgi:hypothetical protein
MKTNSAANQSNDSLIAYINSHPNGVGSQELAEAVLKFKSPVRALAHRMILEILKENRRCRIDGNNLWFPVAAEKTEDDIDICDMPWTAVFVLAADAANGGGILYVSAWNLFPEPCAVMSHWMKDPALFIQDDRDILCGPFDEPFVTGGAAIESLASILDSRTAIFLSSKLRDMLARDTAVSGFGFPEDTMLISGLLKASDVKISRTVNLTSVYEAAFGRSPVSGTALRQAECFAEACWEALRRLTDRGTATRSLLEKSYFGELQAEPWPGFEYPPGGIEKIPVVPGVYGFSDSRGSIIYVGKAKNLRRRLKWYFQNSEDPPARLTALREQARKVIFHRCGSELESLILEYRLIKKHCPPLNTVVSIAERKGGYRPVLDSIVLLPHAEPDMGMCVWVRQDKKVVLRPFKPDSGGKAELIEEMNQYFFGPPPPPDFSDFPEMEIVSRWVRRYETELTMIPVNRLATAEEILESIKNAWDEAPGFR